MQFRAKSAKNCLENLLGKSACENLLAKKILAKSTHEICLENLLAK